MESARTTDRKRYPKPTRGAVALAVALAAPAALAAAPEAGEPEGGAVLDEITVTARQQEVELQEAPVAVSAVSGADLDQAGIAKLDDFNGYVPSLVVAKNDGAGRVASIRGVGWETAQNLSTQPGVLFYLDGVYVANPLAFGLDLGDVERVEVYRGPQGTEFGQVTAGGAVNVVTRRADFDARSGYLELGLGTYGLVEMEAGVNLPIGQRLAVRASGRRLEHDGFSEIRGGAFDGYGLDDADSLASHLAVEWLASDSVSVRLAGYFHESSQHGAAQKHVEDPNPRPRELTQDFPSAFGLDNRSASLTIDWTLPGGLELRALTGRQRLDKRQTVDGDRLTEDLVAVDLTGFGPVNFDLLPFWDNGSSAFSQEVDLKRRGVRLDWVAGLYYLDLEDTSAFLEAVGPAPASQFADRLADPSPETLPPFVPPLEFVEERSVTRRERALFGQGTYRLGARWALTFGARLQRERTRDRATQFWFLDSEQRLEDEAFTWKLGSDVRLSDNHLLYLLASTGRKNGGGNPGALTGPALDVPATFEPEEVLAFEVGSRNSLAAGRVRLNATAFVYDYDNFQFLQEDPVPFSAGTGNIPQVEIAGLETELSWQAGQRLRIDGHLTLLDGEIKSPIRALDVVDFLSSGFGRFTPTGVADRAGLRVGLAGNAPPKLPDLSARLLLTHRSAFAGGAVLVWRLDSIYRGAYYYRVFNNPAADRVPAYATVSAFVAFEPAGAPLELALRATNLFDRAGVNSRFTNPFGLHTTSEELIPPRQLVASVRYRF